MVVLEYRDAEQRVAMKNDDWSVEWLGNDNENGLLEVGELAEITVDLATTLSTTEPSTSTAFVLEIKPPSGAVLNLQRTTPAWLEVVNDLK